MSTNPFNFDTPAEEMTFCGRHKMVNSIAADLGRLSGASHAIIGGLHMGKSSLLRAVARALRISLENAKLRDLTILPIDVSLQAMPQAANQDDVLGFFLRRIYGSFSGPFRPSKLNSNQELLDKFKTCALQPASSVSLQTFENAIREIISDLEPLFGPTRIVLFIESIEIVAEASWVYHLFDNLNALVHNGDLRDHVRIVITGAERLLEIKQKGSPLLTRLRLHFLETLSEKDVHELFELTPELSQKTRLDIISQSGGHPFIVQYLLYYFWESVVDQNSTNIGQEIQRFVNDRSADLEHWWASMGDLGQQMYCFLCKANGSVSRLNIVQTFGPKADAALKRLVYYGLISHDGTFKQFKPLGRIFNEWSEARCGINSIPVLVNDNTQVNPNRSVVNTPRWQPKKPFQPRILIMKGGGVKGIAYVGALQALEEYGYTFNHFVGTSAGAITAALLAVGYTSRELGDVLAETNFKQFTDGFLPLSLFLLPFRKGLYKGENFNIWLEERLRHKLPQYQNSVDIYFNHVRDRRLTVFTSVKGKTSFTFDTKKTSEERITFACRCSMAIPYFFMPEKISGKIAVDGGMQNNYPVYALRDFLESNNEPPEDFLGLYLGHKSVEKSAKLFFLDLFSIFTEAKDEEAKTNFIDRTIVIDPRPVKTTDFSLTPNDIKFLLAEGKASALHWLHYWADGKRPTEDDILKAKTESEKLRKIIIEERFRHFWFRISILFLLLGLIVGIFFIIWLLFTK